jgi:hypothetical protein
MVSQERESWTSNRNPRLRFPKKIQAYLATSDSQCCFRLSASVRT